LPSFSGGFRQKENQMDFTLRPWTPGDLDSVVKNAANAEIIKFMSDSFPDSCDKWKLFIDRAIKDDSIFYCAIDVGGIAIGGIGVSPQKDILKRNAEIGYWLGEAYRGRGIMTDAIRAMVSRAFAIFEINRIFATPFENNTASHRVLEKAGFKLEARFEKIVIKNGEVLDELVYAIRK
jgi:RimJ/RimL family protein N-acetyltransferase